MAVSPEFISHLCFFPASVRASSWSKEPPSSSSRAAARKDQRPRPTINMQVGTLAQKKLCFLFFCPCFLHKWTPDKRKIVFAEVAFLSVGLSVFILNCVMNRYQAGSDLSRPAAEHQGCSQIISNKIKSQAYFREIYRQYLFFAECLMNRR